MLLNCHNMDVCALTLPGCWFNDNELVLSGETLLPRPIYSFFIVKSLCMTSHCGSCTFVRISKETLVPWDAWAICECLYSSAVMGLCFRLVLPLLTSLALVLGFRFRAEFLKDFHMQRQQEVKSKAEVRPAKVSVQMPAMRPGTPPNL